MPYPNTAIITTWTWTTYKMYDNKSKYIAHGITTALSEQESHMTGAWSKALYQWFYFAQP